ncbi:MULTISPECIES: two-component system VirA-like sensor kinase [Rhodomicrobium]|uniref:two-component system VirA-like sensor kinase n=1 Tax=Rhodomicrobium TaxID=1068 RepID=UPI000B4AC0F7|nr:MULTISPECIES: two-component system VirA-like sensor kinase [Rhodomicrobium]
MRLSSTAAAASFLLLLLSWLLVRGLNLDAQSTVRAMQALDRLAVAQSALHRDVLRARSGLLRNYDPLVKENEATRAALECVRNIGGQRPEFASAIDTLSGAVDQQEQLVEKFKSANSLLQNSLAYFGFFSTRLNIVDGASAPPIPAVSSLAVAMLHLTLDTSEAAAREVEVLLDQLSGQALPVHDIRGVDALLAHGRMLQRLLPETDRILKSLFQLPIEADIGSLRSAVLEFQRASEDKAQHYRVMLYGLSLLLLSFLIFFALRLRSRAQILSRRAALEHTIAGISTRFINSRSHELGNHIEAALGELAERIGADRAYFSSAGIEGRFYTWSREGVSFPEGWPQNAPSVLASLSKCDDGILQIPDVDAMPRGPARTALSAAGIAGWISATAQGGKCGGAMLGFDAVWPHAIATSGEVTLLRMAFDAIAHAFDREALEAERDRVAAHLQRARRMETVGALASGIAHNFNNIVGAILGYTEMAQGQARATGGRLAHSIEEIRRAGERARDLVDQILTFGRRRDPSFTRLQLSDVLNESRSLLTASLPPQVELMIEDVPVPAIISGEAGQLQQVILNLCRNAAQAMNDNGMIRIETRLFRGMVPRLSHGSLPPGRYWVVSVVDQGGGMDESTAKRIFEPFYTTRMGGTGLGLATVRDIVMDHRGAIDVKSAPGAGSSFEVWLPCAGAELIQAPATTQPVNVALGHGEAVLVVADERERLLRNEEMLAALGYEPVGFVSPSDALAAWKASPKRFDAALVGQITSACAITLAGLLHETAPQLPIVMASVSSDEYDVEALIEAGVFDLVRQPLASAELAGVLARSLARSRPPMLARS